MSVAEVFNRGNRLCLGDLSQHSLKCLTRLCAGVPEAVDVVGMLRKDTVQGQHPVHQLEGRSRLGVVPEFKVSAGLYQEPRSL